MKPIKKKALPWKCTYSVPLGLFLPRCFTFPVSWHPQLTAGVSQLTPLPPVAWPKAGWCRELQQRSCGSRPFGSSRTKGEKKANSASWVHFVGWQYLVDCSLARICFHALSKNHRNHISSFLIYPKFSGCGISRQATCATNEQVLAWAVAIALKGKCSNIEIGLEAWIRLKTLH